MASVLEALDVASVIQKARRQDAIPLHGGDLIARWQRQLDDYPAPLREAMVRHYLAFPAVWALHDRLERDGTIWRTEMMVGVAYNLLGTLAGLNRRYFSPFQFSETDAPLRRAGDCPGFCGSAGGGISRRAGSRRADAGNAGEGDGRAGRAAHAGDRHGAGAAAHRLASAGVDDTYGSVGWAAFCPSISLYTSTVASATPACV
ncbi:MAG: hypothetical protein U0703_24425 [Anaerolineae bacterium]